MSSPEKMIRVGQRVRVSAKGVSGTVAYCGYPTFATGRWVGVVLDEPKGKNNGTIRGHAYFTCEENYGMFVRFSQLTLLDEEGNPLDPANLSPEDTRAARSRLSRGAHATNQVVISLVGRLPPVRAPFPHASNAQRSMRDTIVLTDSSYDECDPSNTMKFDKPKDKLLILNSDKSSCQTQPHFDQKTITGLSSKTKFVTTVLVSKRVVSTVNKLSNSQPDCSTKQTGVHLHNLRHKTGAVESGVRRKTSPAPSAKPVSLSVSSSRQSLAGSRQSLSASLQSPGDRAGTPETTNKRAAFVETNFVETLNPQFTPGQSLTSPQQSGAGQTATNQSEAPPTTAVEDKLALLQAQQEIVELKASVEDLTEKLDTLRLRRLEDREKLKELERVRLQLEQLAEFKVKIMESHAALQRDLQRARLETREAQVARDAHAEEMADLSETAEMAALDKEMAEEKAETLQLELDSCRERLEEALLDLQLLRAELDAAGVKESGGAGSTYELRQLEQQNARLRDTLVRLRDLSAHEKHHMQKMQKDLDQKKSEITELGRTKEKLSSRVEELEGQIADLQEQIELNDVDAALGAEEMVEQLGERKMALEDEVAQLKEEVAELEALQEVHEQLVESNHELEQDLREELDMAHAATREAVREREAALETVLDREQTITKFRELVQRLNEQSQQYRDKLNDKDSIIAPVAEQQQQQLEVFGSRQANTRAVDLQLRALQLRQALEHAALLKGYMPDHLMARGGDHDAILLLLLIPRMICKAEILLGQLREKFPAVSTIDRDTVVKSHSATQFSFRCRMHFQLHMLLSVLQQYSAGLQQGTVSGLLRAAAALPELAAQERPLDAALELLRADRLDENCPTADLEKSYAVLFTMQPALLGPQLTDPHTPEGQKIEAGGMGWARPGESLAVRSWCSAVAAALEGLACDGAVLKALLQPGEECNELQQLEELVAASTENLLQQLKTIRRRLPVDSVSLGLEPEWWERVGVPLGRAAWRAASCCQEAARHSCQAAALCEPSRLPAPNLRKLWAAASDRHYAQDDQGPLQSVKASLQLLLAEVAQLAQYTQQQEYQIHGTLKQDAKIVSPILQRAELVKKQLEETKSLTLKLENKEADLRELKKILKSKQDEMSEMQIRKELAEKKLSSAARDQELQVEKLNRKLEDAHNQLKRKEKEFEETMDHLQQDIDSLELERGALRDKLKLYGKKDRPAAAPGDAGSPVGDADRRMGRSCTGDSSDTLQEEVALLHSQLQRERDERVCLERDSYSKALQALTPLPAPDTDRTNTLASLRDKFAKFQFDWTMFLAKSGVCHFPENLGDYEKVLEEHKEAQRMQRKVLLARLEEIQREVREEFLSRRPWRSVDTELARFPSVELTRCLLSNAGQGEMIAEYSVRRGTEHVPPHLVLGREQLARLREAGAALHMAAAC